MPDGLLVEPTFPPSLSTINALLQAGFEFSSIAPHDPNDLMFVKRFDRVDFSDKTDQVIMVLHLVSAENKLGKLLVLMRDTCNNDSAAFEEYKAAKLEARGDGNTKWISYKIKKGQSSLISRLREQVGLPPTLTLDTKME